MMTDDLELEIARRGLAFLKAGHHALARTDCTSAGTAWVRPLLAVLMAVSIWKCDQVIVIETDTAGGKQVQFGNMQFSKVGTGIDYRVTRQGTRSLNGKLCEEVKE